MKVLLDTNILVRGFVHKAGIDATASIQAIDRLEDEGHSVVVTEQSLYEFYVVATRPLDVNGYGLVAQQALDLVRQIGRSFQNIFAEPETFQIWHDIVSRYQFSGKVAHDARLAAVAMAHGITHIMTLNPKDFLRLKELRVLTPAEVMS